MLVTLVDRFGELSAAVDRVGWPELARVLTYTDVRDVPAAPDRRVAYVSPANSLGFMDGGIDMVYSRHMFPGVEGAVRAAIRARGRTTLLGRPYLDIGEALAVDVVRAEGGARQLLIAAPTMWMPQCVQGTRNAYHALYAALGEAASNGVDELITPGLCTGVGMMPADQAVRQMAEAHADFVRGLPPRHPCPVDAQPKYYENTEFKFIPATEIVRA